MSPSDSVQHESVLISSSSSQSSDFSLRVFAVVDVPRYFTESDCIFAEGNRLSHLTVNKLVSVDFDQIIHSY